MKVALDVSAVPVRVAGAGRYVVELAARLPRSGVDTTLVTRRHDAERWTRTSPDARVASLVPDGRVTRLAYEAMVAGRSATARGADLWHGPHYTMPHRGATPTVVTIHDLTYFTDPQWHERSKAVFFRRAITYAASHARVLVSVSAYSARQLEAIVPVHAPVVVAPLGVDLERFQATGDDESLLRARHLPVGVPFVCFVGTMEPRKGLDVLLEAFTELASRDDEVELWLAGQVGWGEGPIEARLEVDPYRDRVRRLGFVDDDVLPALYRHARAVAYPSRGEGFGLPVLEAMACGAQVVTTADTVMAEVALDAARLVPIGDASALAEQLAAAMAASDDERAAWSRQARARAEAFTWDACVERHLAAYELALVP